MRNDQPLSAPGRPALRPPGLALALSELARASLELSSIFVAAPFLAEAPAGDGHDVVVLPGFACSQRSTVLLRHYLNWLGYRVHDWGFGRNLGLRTVGAEGERLIRRLHGLHEEAGGKLSLVGHSLGGVMAREYARRHPDHVRRVICMGSPFVPDPRGVNQAVSALHAKITGAHTAEWDRTATDPPKTPLVAIFSRSDGIVSPAVCTDDPATGAENIEVFGSHCGLVAHPAVLYAVADRLALPEGVVEPFSPRGWRRSLYGPADLANDQGRSRSVGVA